MSSRAAQFIDDTKAVILYLSASCDERLMAYAHKLDMFLQEPGNVEHHWNLPADWRQVPKFDLLCQLLERFDASSYSARHLGDELETEVSRCEATAWRRDRNSGRPAGRQGLLFDWLIAGYGKDAESFRKFIALMRRG